MDHTTGTLFPYYMGALFNTKSVHCDMVPVCDIRSALCNFEVR